jgi:hypothetical protein
MFTFKGAIKMVDFGLAAMALEEEPTSDSVMGTLVCWPKRLPSGLGLAIAGRK